MKLLFKQRFFSWFDSYDIYDESGNTLYTVKGQLAWGHKLQIYDAAGVNVGTVRQVVFALLPRFEVYIGGQFVGSISKRFSLFKPKYDIDFMGWTVQGNFIEWDYTISDSHGAVVATIGKEIFNWTDTYSINVEPQNALYALAFTLAIDAEKCSRNN